MNYSERLNNLPPYIFSEINRIRTEAEKQGKKLLSLAIGDPDSPTSELIVEKLIEATKKSKNHLYSPYDGSLSFKRAASTWMQKRFGVTVDAEKETIALIGSKEGISHFPQSLLNPGDKALYPDPGYPIFQTGILLAGGVPVAIPHRPENHFLPDLNELEDLLKTHKPKFMILNYPSNPTTAVCSLEKLTELVGLAKRYETYIVYDNAYCEIYDNADEAPPSILQVPGAKEIAIEFHSLSKTFNMTGWRIAFAVGNPDLVAGLLKIKTNVDSGPLLAVQEASEYALANFETLVPPIRKLYQERKEIILRGLQENQIEYFYPKATFFVWCKVPGKMPSMDFTKKMIQEKDLIVNPGIGFGKYGEGFFRLALTVEPEKLHEAVRRLKV